MDVKELYDQIEVKHGLTTLCRLETIRANAAIAFVEEQQEAFHLRPTEPLGCAPTVPSKREAA